MQCKILFMSYYDCVNINLFELDFKIKNAVYLADQSISTIACWKNLIILDKLSVIIVARDYKMILYPSGKLISSKSESGHL